VWRRTMPGFPAGWVTITRDERGTFSWEVQLVDVAEPAFGRSSANFAGARREALARYEAMGAALQRARGGQ